MYKIECVDVRSLCKSKNFDRICTNLNIYLDICFKTKLKLLVTLKISRTNIYPIFQPYAIINLYENLLLLF